MLQSRLSRFTGASAISSADFYGEEEDGEGGRGRGRRNNFDIENMNASELMSRLSVQVTKFSETNAARSPCGLSLTVFKNVNWSSCRLTGQPVCHITELCLLDPQARQDLSQMGTMAGNAGRKLSSMAQSFMKDLQGSY